MGTFGDWEAFHLMRPLSFDGRDAKNGLFRSVSFNGRDSEPPKRTLTRSHGSAKFLWDRSLSSKRRELRSKGQRFVGTLCEEKPSQEPRKERNQAALKLQKVYKSFRTRRRLADCAVMVEQRWWRLLDFAELKRSSVSFFDIEKPETAVSRWSRARTRAAKVGKGSSKDEKARKLALQHWLEAIDPRHRYGHNLQFYYVKWLRCESKQPFFYWLDIGEGKEVHLEICPRPKLHQQCIKYLGPTERETYEVAINGGKLMYRQSGEVVDTTRGPKDTKWIFVLSTSKTLYVGMKNKGTFQHSSFLAGGATLSAGRLEVDRGILKTIWPHSGHYLPTEENFQDFITFLEERNVDLTDVKKNPNDDNDARSEISGARNGDPQSRDGTETDPNVEPLKSRSQRVVMCSKILTELEIPKRNATYYEDGYETAEETCLVEDDFMVPKPKLFDDGDEDQSEVMIPKEKIIKRIHSHKGMKSYQLGQQLTTKWSTGAGPRIGCMRDYPSDLQFQVLEEANLSPRSKTTFSSPRNLSRFNQSQNSLGLDTTSLGQG